VQPRTGFETHPHKEMEIVTYVLGGEAPRPGARRAESLTCARAGKLTHKDSTGKEGVIGEEDVQLMSAGMVRVGQRAAPRRC
jgi:redox-sensitive bicupin YhaK (pirin superfamily)